MADLLSRPESRQRYRFRKLLSAIDIEVSVHGGEIGNSGDKITALRLDRTRSAGANQWRARSVDCLELERSSLPEEVQRRDRQGGKKRQANDKHCQSAVVTLSGVRSEQSLDPATASP
jgi:hypothetical protein